MLQKTIIGEIQPATEREQTEAPKSAVLRTITLTHKHNQPNNTIRRSMEIPVMFFRGVDVKPHEMIKLATKNEEKDMAKQQNNIIWR